LWRIIYSSGFTQHPDLSLVGILSGIEMACWDIVGKAVEKPAYELLGGQVHDRLRTYTYIYPRPGDKTDVYRDPDLAAERAAEYVQMGFTAVKFDPVSPFTAFDPRQLSLQALDRAETFVRKLREAVGNQADLLFGTHGQMTTSAAIRLARRLEPYDPLWLEEPVPPENAEEMGRVARATTIPIATGERLATKYDFARLLRHGAASILQMNLGRVGGILEAKKIAGMAEAHYAQIAPHLYCGPIVGAANIQLAACSPNFLILEGIETWDGIHAQILNTPIQWEDGYVIPSTAPGLGVELNEDVAAQHPYSGDKLHLEMVNQVGLWT
ncbi:MAG: mandelate racemase/muconate lactonizing enzyme family protein, partial [Anaerolineales bacterium]|nr:mandelate racemase/muconate lactonizing enzyme family protein [Anaerolineales bacterium]